MELIKELEAIVLETSGTYFKLSQEVKTKHWTIYIFRSRITFRGSFEKIIKQAIAEFITYRTPTPENSPRNITQPYRYLKKPLDQKQEEILPNKVKRNLYNEKLNFAKSKGFKNLADCLSEMGYQNFNNQFKEYHANI